MKKLLAIIWAFIFCALPSFAAGPQPEQTPQIQLSSGIPAYAAMRMSPGLTMSPMRVAAFARTNFASAAWEGVGQVLAGMTVGAGTQTFVQASDGYWANEATAASTNANAYIYIAENTEPRWQPRVMWKIKTGAAGDIANVRITPFVTANMGTTMGADVASTSWYGFRFSTAASDTNWQFISDNAGTQTVVDTGVAVSASTVYSMAIDYQASQLVAYINGTKVGTITTNLETSTTNSNIGVGIQTLNATAKNLQASIILVEHN